MLISFVIPCYNSQNTIRNIVEKIDKTVRTMDGFDHEVILVNDCSKDDTFNVIREICKQYKNVKGISFAKNFGQHSALMAGLRICKGEIVVCLDDDGQTPPEEAPKLIEKLQEGYDIVFARYQQKKHNFFRNITSKITNWMIKKFLEKPDNIYLSSFFAAKSFIVKEVIRYNNPYPYMAGLLLRTSNNIENVDVNHQPRDTGRSGYSIKKLFKLWLNGVTSFSVKPLRIAMFIGVLLAFFGFIAVIILFLNKLIHPDVALGWSSIMATLSFIGGIILMVLGMIGEYIGRIFISLNKSPQYVIAQTSNIEEQRDEKE